MRKEPATRLLHLARQLAAEPAGITLDDIAARFAVSRRTAERMRDAVAEVFPQLEEIDGELPKRWRLPNGLSGIFREPLADELAALHGIARRLAHDGLKESAALLESLASKIEASLKPARRRTLAPDVEALLEAALRWFGRRFWKAAVSLSLTAPKLPKSRPIVSSCPTGYFTAIASIWPPGFPGGRSR